MLFENILDEFYEVLLNVILKFLSSSCGRNINLSDDVLLTILIQFEVILQTFHFYLQVADMVNVFIH